MSFLSRSSIMPFPTYILPSLPFRRKGSNDSSASTSSGVSTSGPLTPTSPESLSAPLPSHSRRANDLGVPASYIRCARCAAELCFTDQIVSRGFTGRFGRAYLVAPQAASVSSPTKSGKSPVPTIPNTHTLKAVPRQLVTGAHTVSDVICAGCGVGLGWKYVNAEEESQRYKIGKFILETKRVSTANRWEMGDDDDEGVDETGIRDGDWGGPVADARVEQIMRPAIVNGTEVEFDSQDEEECEDLFLGQWNPETTLKRRKMKRISKT